MTRKLGPLPVWAWAAVVVLAYLAYRHLHGGAASQGTTDRGTTDQAYVPGFDAASGSGSGGLGSMTDPTNPDGLTPSDPLYGYTTDARSVDQGYGTGQVSSDPVPTGSVQLTTETAPTRLTTSQAASLPPSKITTVPISYGSTTKVPGTFSKAI